MGQESLKLATDDGSRILQVGSYRTDSYQNITDTTTTFIRDTVVRVKSYGGDNWLKRIISDVIIIDNSGDQGFVVNGTYLKVSDILWENEYGVLLRPTYNDTWEITTGGYPTYTNTSTSATPPVTGWVSSSSNNDPAPVLTILNDSAAVGEGLLLEEGEELTMLVYAGEAIITTGGTLNIVPVAK